MNFELTEQELAALMQFLARVQITGAEAPIFMGIITKLSKKEEPK